MSFDLMKAIKRPFTDFNKLSLGVLFLIIPYVSIITNFLVKGYRLEVAKTAAGKKSEMPKWRNFWDLFLRGLLSWVIGVIYLLPGIILISISIGNVLYNMISQYGIQGLSLGNSLSDQLIQSSLLQNTPMIPVFAIGILAVLLGAYLAPLAIVRYAEKYKFRSSLNLGLIFRRTFTGKYFLGVLAAVVYLFILNIVVSAISMGYSTLNIQYLTLTLNIVLGGLSSFMVIVTSYTIFGEVYSSFK